MDDSEVIRDQAQKIAASGALGRSRTYLRLFDYLVENSLRGRQVKELEIATEVFAKNSDFDPSQDSMVRVYAHNLRQKLRQFYESAGSEEPYRIVVPRGEYRLSVESAAAEELPAEAESGPPQAAPSWLKALAAGAALLVIGVLIGLAFDREMAESPYDDVGRSPFWSHIMDDDLPVLVVVGDYYIFAELDSSGNVSRFVREFSINSRDDLNRYVATHADLKGRYQDLNVRYLAQSTASALHDIFRVLYTADKQTRVVPMSELDPADLRTNHVIYVGYFSALDKLFDFVFASSSLAIGETFDQLWNIDTGETYTSNAGRPDDYRNYRDYGYFSTFPGPGGNQFAIIAGTRDEGVMQTAQIVTDPLYVPGAEQEIPDGAADDMAAFEMLYEVSGFDRTSIDAMLVHSAPLDAKLIWRGDLLQFVHE